MRRSLLFSLALITLLLPTQSFAQTDETIALSLEEAIDYAMKNQKDMKNAILDQKSSLAKNREVTGLALPNLNANGNVSYAPLVAGFLVDNFIKTAIVGTPDGTQPGLVKSDALNQQAVQYTPDQINFALQPKWTTTAKAELTQVLFDPSIMVALQARKALENVAVETIEMTEVQLKASVTKSYYDVLIAEKRKALVDKNVERISELERETRKTYEVGLAEKIDVDRITVSLNNLKAQQTTTNQMVQVAYMSLKFQTGMDLHQDIILTDELRDEEISAELLTHPFDFNNRAEYRLLETQSKLLSYDVKRYKLGWLPTLSAFGNYGYTLYNMNKLYEKGDQWQKSAMLGVQLNVPIFDGFQRKNKRLQAVYALEKNKNELENLRSGLELERLNAQIALRSNISNLENQRANMQLAEEVYDISRTKYKEGVGSSLEVMDAETALKEAQTNYFSALYDAITAKINLQKALGEL